MKKLKTYTIIGIIIFIFLICIIFGVRYSSVVKKPLKNKSVNIIINVSEGDTLYSIINKIDKQGNLRSKFFTKLYIKMHKTSGSVKAGMYEINGDSSLQNIINQIISGKSNMIKVTIPEGYTINEIAKKLDDSGLCTKDEFINSVKNYKLPNYIKYNKNKRYQLEGFLFPDTYYFTKGIDCNKIIKEMIKRTEYIFQEIEKQTGEKIDQNDYEKILTKASVIEKEARSDEDRYNISSVIDNRIKKNMKLQIDATVIYAHGYHKEKLYNKDLTIDSPYNTYKNYGLPVGPICNPGKESIIAAIKPSKTNYIYYIWTGDSKNHYFTNDYNKFLEKKKTMK